MVWPALRAWSVVAGVSWVQEHLGVGEVLTEVGKVLVVHPSLPASCRKYEEDLYPSTEALQAPCTAKATVYCAAGLAAYVGSFVGGYAVGRQVRGAGHRLGEPGGCWGVGGDTR